jgi:hypothetical protein
VLDRSNPHKATRSRVTGEAKRIFARAMALRPRYDACISGKRCHSTSLNRHCAVCHDYIELSRALHRCWRKTPGTRRHSMSKARTRRRKIRCGPKPGGRRGRCAVNCWSLALGLELESRLGSQSQFAPP